MHLIITEKDLAAKSLSAILSRGKALMEKVGSVNVYKFDNSAVMGLKGHIVTVDFPEQYSKWNVNFHELIKADLIIVPTNKPIVSALKKVAKDSELVTIATDFDREGELIGFEAYNIIKSIKDVGINRVRFSSLTPNEIKKAFKSPSEIDHDLAYSGEARQEVDLIWGAALTRYLSTTSHRLGKNFLSAGRVQSPTLALIVDRERRIAKFVPEQYWEVFIDLIKGDSKFQAKHVKGRFLNKAEASSVVSRIQQDANVTNFSKGEKIDNPPTPFNTTAFLAAASALGIAASRAMNIAEGLYMAGWISYPRTDNTVYPNSLDLRLTVGMFRRGEFAENAEKLLQKQELIPTKGKKQTTDHPPIHPTSKATQRDLDAQNWKIYELIVRRFFATLSDPAKWCIKKIIVESGGEVFKATGLELVSRGWRYHYPYIAINERYVPDLKNGDFLKIQNKKIIEKETQPPQRFGQGQLIKKMEELGLGTKSTRHEIINKLVQRGYIHTNPLRPTSLACAVTRSLECYAPAITKPDMTRLLEEEMENIKDGKLSKDFVVNNSRDMLDSIFHTLDEKTNEIRESLLEGLKEDAIVGECPECGSNLSVRRSKKGGRFIGCGGYPNCNFALPLPKSGRLHVTHKQCQKHKMKLIKVHNGKRLWNLGCPYCNYIDWIDRTKKISV
ncbi:MAG TPA: DNA topoisomerase I [Candidatus Acidoferrum sp.]|nr:DNA topoisomerase I [Candidatus Acidoferrum sp.]